jgi:hypothetical protein
MVDRNWQLYTLSIFQDILDRPIKILRPENEAVEVTIEESEKDSFIDNLDEMLGAKLVSQ